jgi:ribosomal protein L29
VNNIITILLIPGILIIVGVVINTEFRRFKVESLEDDLNDLKDTIHSIQYQLAAQPLGESDEKKQLKNKIILLEKQVNKINDNLKKYT